MRSNICRLYQVVLLVLGTGERLPSLIDTRTGFPARVATRWAVNHRRYRSQSSTLAGDLRALGRLYSWFATACGRDLDDFLVGGGILDTRQIGTLVASLRAEPGESAERLNGSTLNRELGTIARFLIWALDPANRGGVEALTLNELAAARAQLDAVFASKRVAGRASRSMEPLTDREIRQILTTIGPVRDESDGWRLEFPNSPFRLDGQLRNWLMFEVCRRTGVRRGELLKLRINALFRTREGWALRVLRSPDDRADTRRHEPAVKTAERVIGVDRGLVSALRTYLGAPPPYGRGTCGTEYLFTSEDGQPLSLGRVDDIFQAIGRYSGVIPLSPHRLRHTWAECLAERLWGVPHGHDTLQCLGGWTNPESPKRYIKHAIERHASKTHCARLDGLYQEEFLDVEPT